MTGLERTTLRRGVASLSTAALLAGIALASAGPASASAGQLSAVAAVTTTVSGDFDGDGLLDTASVSGTYNEGVLTVDTGAGRVVSAPVPVAWEWYELSSSDSRFGSGDTLWVWSVRGTGFQYLVPFGFLDAELRSMERTDGSPFILVRGENDATRADFGCRNKQVVSIPLTFRGDNVEQVFRETYQRHEAVMDLMTQEELTIEPGSALPLGKHVLSGCGLAPWPATGSA